MSRAIRVLGEPVQTLRPHHQLRQRLRQGNRSGAPLYHKVSGRRRSRQQSAILRSKLITNCTVLHYTTTIFLEDRSKEHRIQSLLIIKCTLGPNTLFIVKFTLVCVASISAYILPRYLGGVFHYTKQFLGAGCQANRVQSFAPNSSQIVLIYLVGAPLYHNIP